MNLKEYNKILKEITSFPQKASLLTVTKYSWVAEINEAIENGVSAIGENRVETAEEKFPLLEGEVEKHFIGVIQTKKIRKIVELFDVIESVGSVKHLKKIDSIAGEIGKQISVFLQFNISREGQKSGFSENDIVGLKEEINNIKNIEIIGVMGMASQSSDEQNREEFKRARRIRDELYKEFSNIRELSIGMSRDYKIALEEGATLVRIGSILFKRT